MIGLFSWDDGSINWKLCLLILINPVSIYPPPLFIIKIKNMADGEVEYSVKEFLAPSRRHLSQQGGWRRMKCHRHPSWLEHAVAGTLRPLGHVCNAWWDLGLTFNITIAQLFGMWMEDRRLKIFNWLWTPFISLFGPYAPCMILTLILYFFNSLIIFLLQFLIQFPFPFPCPFSILLISFLFISFLLMPFWFSQLLLSHFCLT